MEIFSLRVMIQLYIFWMKMANGRISITLYNQAVPITAKMISADMKIQLTVLRLSSHNRQMQISCLNIRPTISALLGDLVMPIKQPPK